MSTPEPETVIAAAQQKASNSSFYSAMRLMPRAQREAMFAIYGFCRIVDDIADDQVRPIAQQRAELQAWRDDIEALYAGRPAGAAEMLSEAVHRYRLEKSDFLAVVDGMEMDLEGIRAPDLATMELYCDRVAVAVGRLSVKVFGMDEGVGEDLSHHLGRALQLTNIVRDVDEDAAMGRLYLPQEYLAEAGVVSRAPTEAVLEAGVDQVCRRLAASAEDHFAEAHRILAAHPVGKLAAPRLMGAVYASLLRQLIARGWNLPRERVSVRKRELIWVLLRRGLLGWAG
jgi:presqualene diphosphate synthase